MGFECRTCQQPHEIPDVGSLAATIAGERWWLAEPVDFVQAVAVLQMHRRGFCQRHASMIGAMLGHAIYDERARRTTLPGTVEIRHVVIAGEPYESITLGTIRRQGRPLIERVEAFVAGSALSAVVELDFEHHRARVTLVLSHDDPLTTVIESPRLVHLTAQELATALRARAGAR